MIIKISKVYVPYRCMRIKCKSTTVYIKNKKGGGAYIMVSKGTLHFEYISKE